MSKSIIEFQRPGDRFPHRLCGLCGDEPATRILVLGVKLNKKHQNSQAIALGDTCFLDLARLVINEARR